jgi:iron(III) transport system substrate-binding protein
VRTVDETRQERLSVPSRLLRFLRREGGRDTSKLGLLRSIVFASAVAAAGMGSAALAQTTRLTVYTALENDQLEPFKKSFEADNPTIEIAWVHDSTGVVAAKLMAEKDNPRADIIWGLAASNVGLMASMGMLEPYTPAGAAALKPIFRSGRSPDTWIGMDAYLSVVCFNVAEAEKSKKVAPASWIDLIKPDYKGSIVMPNPASSGTGYAIVAAWLQIMGEETGWKYMDALHQNIAQYVHSGSAPCVQAAKGERLIGIGLDTRGASEKTKGASLELIIPKEGVGWELEVTAIVKGAKNLEAAKKLADWAVTRKANELYAKTYPIVAYPGVANVPPNYPTDIEKAMVTSDIEWISMNRDRILAEWTKRYDGKSVPKK